MIPNSARRSTGLSRASTCDPHANPRSPHAYPRPGRRRTRGATIASRSSSRSTPLDYVYNYGLVSLSFKTILENLMEVVLDRDAFLKGLQMVQNIVEPRQTLPILANVLIEAEGESVRMTATDLEVGARVSVPAKVGATGAITVSARKRAETVKELRAAAGALRVAEGGHRDHACPRGGRGSPDRDHRESVHSSNAELRHDSAPDRGPVSELRGRHPQDASGQALGCAKLAVGGAAPCRGHGGGTQQA